MDWDKEAKHRKKKPSSTSKARAKSDHKHEYVDVLFVENGHPHKGSYCKLCGKIENIHFFETVKCEFGFRVLDKDEVFEKFKELEQIQIENIWQSYVPVSKEV